MRDCCSHWGFAIDLSGDCDCEERRLSQWQAFSACLPAHIQTKKQLVCLGAQHCHGKALQDLDKPSGQNLALF